MANGMVGTLPPTIFCHGYTRLAQYTQGGTKAVGGKHTGWHPGYRYIYIYIYTYKLGFGAGQRWLPKTRSLLVTLNP